MATPESAVPAVTTPMATGERIHVLDILRGFALLGMILVHFHQKIEVERGGLEGLIGWFTWIAVESKAWGTFAFLFGVGFAILLRSFESKGLPVAVPYLRRLFGLAVLGFIAEAFFGFHVLLEYAMWGVPLLIMRRWSSRALLIAALVSVALGPLLPAVRGLPGARAGASAAPAVVVDAPARPDPAQTLRAAEQGGDYRTLLAARLQVMRAKYGRWTTLLPGSSFALFLIGVLALRSGVFHEPRRYTRLILGWMAFGFVSWGLSWLVWAFAPPLPVPGTTWAVHSALGLIHDQWLCFTYIGGVLLLVTYRPAWLSRLAGFGVAGRMALTNYMLQVTVLDFLSSGYGAGLRVRPIVSLALTALLFGTLVAASRFWLARFRLGPLEWLWRCFTWMRWQPLRRPASAGSVQPAT